jgi:hypothetical protein
MVPLQTGAMGRECRLKHSLAEGGLPTGLPSQLPPMEVISDCEAEDDPLVCTSDKNVGLTHPSEIQRVLATPAVASPLSLGEVGLTPKKAHTKNCLLSSAWYVCGGMLYAHCVTYQPWFHT